MMARLVVTAAARALAGLRLERFGVTAPMAGRIRIAVEASAFVALGATLAVIE